MKLLPIVLLLFAMLVCLVGCGETEEPAAPQAQPTATPEVQPTATPPAQSKAKEAKKAEAATPKEGANPCDTPARLAQFMAQEIGDVFIKIRGLRGMALSWV